MKSKSFQITPDLIFVVTEYGVGIYTNEGDIHMMYNNGTDRLSISSQLISALCEVYTPPDHLNVNDLLSEIQDHIDKH